MANTATIDLRHVARGLNIPLRQVQSVVELLDDGNTVPFVTRYRKDQTGGLDEEQIRQIQARLAKVRQLAERKQTILRSIESQGKLTDELSKQIQAAGTTKRLEDLYLPYKPKKQTLATVARSRGLEPLAREILQADPMCADLDARAADFANADRQIPTSADALLGAGHILAEQFSEMADLRQKLREIFQRTGKFVCARIGGDPKEASEKKEAPLRSDAPKAQGPSKERPAPDRTAESPEPVQESPIAEASPEPAPPEAPASEPEAPSAEVEPLPPQATEQPVVEPPSAELQGAEPPSAEPQPAEAQAVASQPAESPPAEAIAAPIEGGTDAPPEIKPAESEVKPATAEGAPAKAKSKPAKASEPKPASPPKPQPPKLTKRELRKKKEEERKNKAFQDYFDYAEEIKKIPHHRVLAINRGERAKAIRVKVEIDLAAMYDALDEMLVPKEHPHGDYLRGCARDALTRLILPGLEREARRELTDRAELHAVEVFARNLRNLLLQPPIHGRRALAVDPGFKSGCKLVALDQFGNVLGHDIIYLFGKNQRREQAKEIVLGLVNRFHLTVVVIGNGTACRETEDFFAGLIGSALKGQEVVYVIANEAGASVYSTSPLGREEFPEYDATLRSAISIGRRLQDPLSELVKIDPASIGVGLYQHDVKANHLRSSLDEVVESCVNYVGVDVNMASPALLRYVSGLNQLTARRVYEHRREHGPFRNREQLRDVAGFGEATFVQAAGFLKITSGDLPLDATWIHPESYAVAMRVLEKLGFSPLDLGNRERSAALAEQTGKADAEQLAGELQVGTLLLRDILSQFARPGRDPRDDLPPPVFKKGILKLEDLAVGMELTGTVLNVVDFGCFVDIGMHDSGLVHVSQLADRFVRDPHEVVAVGDIVKVWVLDVDKARRRVSLTMIQPGSERRQHGGKPEKPKEGAEKPQGKPRPRPEQGKGRPPRKPQGDRSKGPPKPKDYQPKRPPKPLIPITDAMKTGAEPMRTFGDLLQFYAQKEKSAQPEKKPEQGDGEPPSTQ
jgi:uncharacterized protein